MSFAADYEAYLDWTREPKNPEEFQRLRDARAQLDAAFSVFYEMKDPSPELVKSVMDRVRKARDLI